ncbi:MAG: hypothetical protein GY794_11680 [bacterium]|nr:hypothetical protein [bacterium]
MPPENNHQLTDDRDLARAVLQCQPDSVFLRAILDVYEELDRLREGSETICLGGGACCRFDLFDHRLYVTIGELAILRQSPQVDPSRCDRNRCPYQQGPGCMAREKRPLGCRVFFCREKPDMSDTKDGGTYETFHRKICNVHKKHDVPYVYIDLISGLKILDKFYR